LSRVPAPLRTYIGEKDAAADVEALRGNDVIVRIEPSDIRIWDFVARTGRPRPPAATAYSGAPSAASDAEQMLCGQYNSQRPSRDQPASVANSPIWRSAVRTSPVRRSTVNNSVPAT